MNFNFDNERPIYKQLVDTLTELIIIGTLEPGSKILSVRDFAVKTKVNPNTMQRALSELEEQGLIYTERTNGKFVTTDNKLITSIKEKLAKNKIDNYFTSMKDLGFNKADALKYINSKGEK